MLISYNWLRELTSTKLKPQDVRERLTNVGLAIDAVEERGDDFVLDVEVPSNRGDCLSHVGVARELAVIEQSQVSSPESQVTKTKDKTSDVIEQSQVSSLKSQVSKAKGKTSDFAAIEIIDPDLDRKSTRLNSSHR